MSSNVPVLSISFRENNYSVTVSGGEFLSTAGRYDVLGVHGAGVVNAEHFIANAKDLALALGGFTGSVEALGASIRGALTLYVRDTRTGNDYVVSDPLGASTVFRFTHDKIEYVSSSLPALLAELGSHGIRPRKSLKYAALLASTGHGGLVESPYEGVVTFGLFEYVSLGQDGIAVHDYPMKDDFFGYFNGYGTDLTKLRKRLVDDIAANVRAATNYRARSHVCQLSSGIDDRMVTAAINYCGCGQEYNAYNNGIPSDPNTLISLQLAGRFGYQVSNDPGYSVAMIAGQSVEDSRWRLHETAGVLRGPATPGITADSRVLLTSGFANLLGRQFTRANVTKTTGLPPESGIDLSLTGAFGDPNSRHGRILGDALLADFQEVLDKLTGRMAEINAPACALDDFVWLATKGRYRDGESSRSMSTYVARFDPLYSPWALPTAWCYSKSELSKHFLKLDLMTEFDRVSVSLPFGSGVDVNEYMLQRPTLKKQDFVDAPAVPTRRKIYSSPLTCHKPKIQISEKHKKDATRLKVPVRLIAGADSYQMRIREIISEIDKKSLEACFNTSSLTAMLDSRPQRLSEFRSLQNLHDSLAWYVEQN